MSDECLQYLKLSIILAIGDFVGVRGNYRKINKMEKDVEIVASELRKV